MTRFPTSDRIKAARLFEALKKEAGLPALAALEIIKKYFKNPGLSVIELESWSPKADPDKSKSAALSKILHSPVVHGFLVLTGIYGFLALFFPRLSPASAREMDDLTQRLEAQTEIGVRTGAQVDNLRKELAEQTQQSAATIKALRAQQSDEEQRASMAAKEAQAARSQIIAKSAICEFDNALSDSPLTSACATEATAISTFLQEYCAYDKPPAKFADDVSRVKALFDDIEKASLDCAQRFARFGFGGDTDWATRCAPAKTTYETAIGSCTTPAILRTAVSELRLYLSCSEDWSRQIVREHRWFIAADTRRAVDKANNDIRSLGLEPQLEQQYITHWSEDMRAPRDATASECSLVSSPPLETGATFEVSTQVLVLPREQLMVYLLELDVHFLDGTTTTHRAAPIANKTNPFYDLEVSTPHGDSQSPFRFTLAATPDGGWR